MMRFIKWAALGVIGLALVIVILLTVISMMATRPSNIGHRDGQLAACPDSPNCVSSRATEQQHAMPPIPFTDDADEAMARLEKIIEAQPRAKIVSRDERYLHAEFTSLIFRFTDDVEFLIDPDERVIHFRSASRVGHSDLGANRARMKEITERMSGS